MKIVISKLGKYLEYKNNVATIVILILILFFTVFGALLYFQYYTLQRVNVLACNLSYLQEQNSILLKQIEIQNQVIQQMQQNLIIVDTQAHFNYTGLIMLVGSMLLLMAWTMYVNSYSNNSIHDIQIIQENTIEKVTDAITKLVDHTGAIEAINNTLSTLDYPALSNVYRMAAKTSIDVSIRTAHTIFRVESLSLEVSNVKKNLTDVVNQLAEHVSKFHGHELQYQVKFLFKMLSNVQGQIVHLEKVIHLITPQDIEFYMSRSAETMQTFNNMAPILGRLNFPSLSTTCATVITQPLPAVQLPPALVPPISPAQFLSVLSSSNSSVLSPKSIEILETITQHSVDITKIFEQWTGF